MENILIIYRICMERNLQPSMHPLFCLLFVMNISCTTAIEPNKLLGLGFGLDHIYLGFYLFQMLIVHTPVIPKPIGLMHMIMDRYLVISRSLNCDIINAHLLLNFFFIALIECSLFSSPIKTLDSQVHFCSSNINWNFACENIVLLNLGYGGISKIQVVVPMMRILDICLLLISYMNICFPAVKISKALHKTLHTCSTHLIVVVLNCSCGLVSAILYRMPISVDVQNLFSTIYYMFLKEMAKLIEVNGNNLKLRGIPESVLAQDLEEYLVGLLKATLAERRAFLETTKILRDNNISYCWGFPVKLVVNRQGTMASLASPEEARKALRRWNPRSPPHKQAQRLCKEWQEE
ncbi:hypothetical protein XELAEV_18013939mg [Xenopus laevis]|uniref:G-protein coupled receptors family 1 profile domain-containing protein n=1 Tax=Xenopus laevis TaxID=8355 RepID=A0A974DQH7_XENLA|nr:hypothetical protein XELAEV_18013939mg [Xenopus laevis]